MTKSKTQKNLRVYVLRLSSQFSKEKSLSLFGSLSENEKNLISIKEEFNKALRAGYDRILLPWNFIFHSEKQKLITWINSQAKNFILAVHPLSFKIFKNLFKKSNHLYLELNLENYDKAILKELEQSPWSFYILIPAHKKMNLENLSQQLIQNHNQSLEKNTNQSDLSLLKVFSWLKNESPSELLRGIKMRFSSFFFLKKLREIKPKEIKKNLNTQKKSYIKQLVTKYKFLFKKPNFKFSDENSFFYKNKIPVFVHFPCSHKAHPELFNSKEMYHFLNKSYFPPPPYDIYNLSIPKDLKLEPENKAEVVYELTKNTKPLPEAFINSKLAKVFIANLYRFQDYLKSVTLSLSVKIKNLILKKESDENLNKSKLPYQTKYLQNSGIKASVIIPAYNSEKELILTLKHLHQQDFPKEKWELIIVDDGSEKKLSQSLKNLKFLKEINFKFIFFPREFPRTGPKDHRFRAGIARNLGVKYAKGENLLFLDSDILTPPHYISSACELLETHELIQHPRYHLKQLAPNNYKDIDKKQHTFIKINSYWENFYKTGESWNKKKLPWKYISTNSLGLKTNSFKKVGGFRKNYTLWGFEDTDLGYRLYQAGCKFKLSPNNTYHLFRPSEFADSKNLREELLGLSALTFFHNNHDLFSYKEFLHLIKN